MPEKKFLGLSAGDLSFMSCHGKGHSEAHSAEENAAGGEQGREKSTSRTGRKGPDAPGVDVGTVLVGAVTSQHPGTSLLLCGSAAAQPLMATHGEKRPSWGGVPPK